MSYGQSPALVAIAMKAAISALQGNVMPQLISIPIPVADLQGPEGRRELLAGPERPISSPPTSSRRAASNFTAPQIMAQSEKNTQ